MLSALVARGFIADRFIGDAYRETMDISGEG